MKRLNSYTAPVSADKLELHKFFSRNGVRNQKVRRFIRSRIFLLTLLIHSALKRTLDITISFILLLILFPVWYPLYLTHRIKRKELIHTPMSGQHSKVFYKYVFDITILPFGRIIEKSRFHRIPVLFNILKGDMSFIGPRAVTPIELNMRKRDVRKRFGIRPGIFCTWWIRRRANIDFSAEIEVDNEYIDGQNLKGDLGIALRTIPAFFYGERSEDTPDSVNILGIPIDNITMDEAVEKIIKLVEAETPKQVCFVNPHCVNCAVRDKDYFEIIKNAGITLADGIGLKLAGKILGREFRQNVNGTDLFPRLCEKLSDTGKSLYLLGGLPGVAKEVSEWINKNYPKVKVQGYHQGYLTKDNNREIVERIAESGADILLTAMGVPLQERWISENIDRLNVKVAIGVGGLFDFYSGRISRAPVWIREIGMEWLYRFYQEPGRMWKRYFVGNALFLFRVIIDKYKVK